MQTLADKIAEAIGKYHKGFMQKKVLRTVEEIEATTDPLDKYVAGAGSVNELNNKLDNLLKFKTYNITTQATSNISPFTHSSYVTTGLKNIKSVVIDTKGKTTPITSCLIGNSVFICTMGAITIDVIVGYI